MPRTAGQPVQEDAPPVLKVPWEAHQSISGHGVGCGGERFRRKRSATRGISLSFCLSTHCGAQAVRAPWVSCSAIGTCRARITILLAVSYGAIPSTEQHIVVHIGAACCKPTPAISTCPRTAAIRGHANYKHKEYYSVPACEHGSPH